MTLKDLVSKFWFKGIKMATLTRQLTFILSNTWFWNSQQQIHHIRIYCMYLIWEFRDLFLNYVLIISKWQHLLVSWLVFHVMLIFYTYFEFLERGKLWIWKRFVILTLTFWLWMRIGEFPKHLCIINFFVWYHRKKRKK